MRFPPTLLLLPLLLSACRTEETALPQTPARLPAVAAAEERLLDAGEFARARGLSVERTFSGAGATLRGQGRELICRAGLRSALVDGDPVRLGRPVEEHEGRLLLPEILVDAADRAWHSRPPAPPVAALSTPSPLPSAPRPAGNDLSGRLRIVLDPGHGGDILTGARGANGSYEKDVNLDIAKKLQELLEARGMEVILLREDDRAFYLPTLARASYRTSGEKFNTLQKADLEERVRIANRTRPDLFVSIHANWAASAEAEGFEVYYPRPTDQPAPPTRKGKSRRAAFDWSVYGAETSRILDRMALGTREEARWKDSRALAEAVRGALHGAIPAPDRGARMADFKVIRESEVPAILVETGFLSNPEEEKSLNAASYQRRVAEALADGIDRYLSKR